MALKLSTLAGIVAGLGNIASSQLRFVTTNNRVATGTAPVSASNTALAFRIPYVIGSGDVSSVIFTWNNFDGGSTDVANTLAMTLTGVVVENDAGTVQKAINIAGQTYPYTLQPLALDVRHDTLYPSDMGVTAFTPGTKLWLKGYATFSGSGVHPAVSDRVAEPNSTKGLWSKYDPTSYVVSDLSVLGKQTGTVGGTPTSFPVTTGGINVPFAIGTFVQPVANRLPSFTGYGDSNLAGFGDLDTPALTRLHGKGEFQRMLAGDGSNAQLMAGGNFSIAGFTIQLINKQKMTYWAQFSDRIIDEVLGNSFGTTGTTDQNLVRGYKQAIWASYKQYAPFAKVISTDIGPHTTGAYVLADQSDQVNQPGYVAGGNVEIFRAWHAAQVGVAGAIDSFVQLAAWRAGIDPLLWTPGGTTDGTHGTTTIVTAKAAQLRTAALA